MAKSNFLLVSLEEEDSKKLAQVLSNKTSRKILDFLAENHKVSETKISKETKIPISTVHYNVQQLVKAGLVVADEYHYSKKGREVLHYSLANKYVIIAPKKSKSSLKEKLKRIFPVALITGLTGALIHIFSSGFGMMAKTASTSQLSGVVSEAVPVVAERSFDSATNVAIQETPTIIEKTVYSAGPIALWFIIGAVFAILVYLFTDYVIKKIKEN